MYVEISLFVFTENRISSPSVLLQKCGRRNPLENGQPFPFPGRWMPSCVMSRIRQDESLTALKKALFDDYGFLLKNPRRGKQEPFIRIDDCSDESREWWAIEMPFADVATFRLKLNGGNADLFTRQEIEAVARGEDGSLLTQAAFINSNWPSGEKIWTTDLAMIIAGIQKLKR